jgi:uncharacterized coiled-coil DUF342 family protein
MIYRDGNTFDRLLDDLCLSELEWQSLIESVASKMPKGMSLNFNRDTIDELQNEVDNLERSVEELEQDLVDKENEILDLEKKLKTWKDLTKK